MPRHTRLEVEAGILSPAPPCCWGRRPRGWAVMVIWATSAVDPGGGRVRFRGWTTPGRTNVPTRFMMGLVLIAGHWWWLKRVASGFRSSGWVAPARGGGGRLRSGGCWCCMLIRLLGPRRWIRATFRTPRIRVGGLVRNFLRPGMRAVRGQRHAGTRLGSCHPQRFQRTVTINHGERVSQSRAVRRHPGHGPYYGSELPAYGFIAIREKAGRTGTVRVGVK